MKDLKHALTILIATSALFSGAAFAAGPHYTSWGLATEAPDTDFSVAGGCPIESRDGLTIYMASSREGGLGNLDIWVADRLEIDEPFGEAENLGAPVNSEYADYCPTPLNQNYLLFVSTRPGADTCGMGDMYIIKRNPAQGWGEPVNLGCAATGDGPNTAGGEFSPSLVKYDGGVFLYYSSDGSGNMDIFVSEMGEDGHFGPGVRVDELSTEWDDRMPNISKDGREIVFSSNRPTWGNNEPAIGGQDVYTSRRDSTDEPWSPPVNLGPGINTTGDETRASMSWDRDRLYFGRGGEIYVSHRTKVKGKK